MAENIRIERLRKREWEHFGSRIDTGGNMYKNHLEFINWAAAYDTGRVEMKSKAMHDEWQKLLKCRQIVLDGSNNFNRMNGQFLSSKKPALIQADFIFIHVTDAVSISPAGWTHFS